MFHREALRSSVEALRANKFRAFLTALGLVIGNASVILVVTISLTSRHYILDLIQGIGSNLIYAQYEAGNNGTTAAADADYIKIADVDAVRARLGSRIIAASAVMNNLDRMRVNGREEDVAIVGTDQYYPQVRNLDLLAGRFFDGADVQQRQHVALMMQKLRGQTLWGPTSGDRQDHQAAWPAIHRHRHVSRESFHVRNVGVDRQQRRDPDHGAEVFRADRDASILYTCRHAP